jgi:hypothetical protein
MNPVLIVVSLEVPEFSLKVPKISEEGVVKIFTTNRANEPLNEGA